ncbi:hypothetical protein [Natronorubrum sp. DTA7]|uniref:hypothetical protein n=1 Tax=Natronorubrum sp. DTA7 TaxID=3447016 RepID=UPI003F862A16
MSRLERVANWLRTHPVLTVFLCLAAVPILLTAFSFRQPIPLPDVILSELEVLFRLLVYAPVSAIRSLVFEPLGLDVLFVVPGLGQATVFLVLLGFYYCLSLGVVRIGSRLYARLKASHG